MLAAVFEKEIKFFFNIKSARRGAGSQFTSPRAIGGLKTLHDLIAETTEVVGEEGGLGGFSRAIDPFDHDEFS